MNKNLTYGLAASTLVLSVALAYSIGANSAQENQTYANRMLFETVQANSEWKFEYMGNRMSTWENDRLARANSLEMGMYGSDQENCDEELLLDEANLDLTGTDIDEAKLLDMLTVLINDEYKARAEYVALVDEFGSVNPFYQLINAETMHIEALSNVFEAYGLDIPEDNGEDFAIVPSTLEEAYEIGVVAEIDNIALYEGYLNLDLPEAVQTVFENLMNASEHHLAAFEAHVDGYDSTNTMMGRDFSTMGGRGRRR